MQTIHSVGGLATVIPLKAIQEDERKRAEQANNAPVVQALAGHLKTLWSESKREKEMGVERRMLQSLRQKKGEYDPDILSDIKQQGGSDIYMRLSSVKARAAASWLRDVLLGARDEKPWLVQPTPIPDLPPEEMARVTQTAMQEAYQIEVGGQGVTPELIYAVHSRLKERMMANVVEEARKRADRMNMKMEDQLIEGGFHQAFSEFIDDLTTFPAAIMKGPVIRNRAGLKWSEDGQMEVVNTLKMEWERVDPFMLYPAPNSTSVENDYLFERHALSRTSLNAMIGVEGYNDGAIKAVLAEYGRGGLREWLSVDSERQTEKSALTHNTSTIEALQFWGSVQGSMLREWGMSDEEVPEPTEEYNVEVWLVGTWVIKAIVNPDPLGRKPYYKASYEEVPGEFWGNSIMDLIRDCQIMCNASARALANNMGISSGPQVIVNIDRLPSGEDITKLYPWKIWQVNNDQLAGNTANKPIDFFVPPSLSAELVAVQDHFSKLADEYSGIPRYMTGDNNVGGAARTASGMSMLMGNAGKAMKQVVAYIDNNVLQPMVERLYNHNMRYSDDPELKGDVSVIARGANALIIKEQEQVRRNEFLQIVLASPQIFELVGMEGLAEIVRPIAAGLNIDTDKLIPPAPVLRQRQQKAEMMQQLAMQAEANARGQAQAAKTQVGSGQKLADGAEVTDNFAPTQRG